MFNYFKRSILGKFKLRMSFIGMGKLEFGQKSMKTKDFLNYKTYSKYNHRKRKYFKNKQSS